MFDICENYKSYLTIDSLNIGYAKSSSVFFVIFPIITFIFNISVLIFYWLNRKNKKTSQYLILNQSIYGKDVTYTNVN